MTRSFIILTTFILLTVLSTANLRPTSIEVDQIITLNPSQTIELIVKEQSELYQKALRDYLNNLIKSIPSSERANRIILQKISSQTVWDSLRNFMIDTLFVKFEMNTLSESFGAEIRQFPDNYFLTFEMYDLLHD